MKRLRQDDAGARAAVEAVLHVKIAAPFAGLLIEDERGPCGAVIVNNYVGRDAHITVVSDRAVTSYVARELARYIFGKLGCMRMTAVIRSSDNRAAKALARVGFREEGRLRDYFDDADGLIFGLLQREQKLCRIET